MKTIFEEIKYHSIPENKGKEIYLKSRMEKDISAEEKAEIMKWTVMGSTLYEKEIDGITFLIDIYPEGE